MSKLEQAKDAILDRIMDQDELPNYVKILAEAYEALINAETQARMTDYATSGSDFDDMEEIA